MPGRFVSPRKTMKSPVFTATETLMSGMPSLLLSAEFRQ